MDGNRERLLAEMIERFHNLPKETVRAHVNLYPRNREALVGELTRVSLITMAANGIIEPTTSGDVSGGIGGEGGSDGRAEESSLYSNFETSLDAPGARVDALGSLPFPESPPSLVITPPASPEKTANKSLGQMSTASVNGPANIPALSIARDGSRMNREYEAFLLQNQRQRLRAIEEAYARNKACLEALRREVMDKERLLYKTMIVSDSDDAGSNTNVNITIDTLLELSQVNRQLTVQNSCLVTEVDLQTDGRAMFGFYDNIYSGPQDPMIEMDSRISPPRNSSRAPETVRISRQDSSGGGGGAAASAARDDRVQAADGADSEEHWACIKCTLLNHPDIVCCEACASPRCSASSASAAAPAATTTTVMATSGSLTNSSSNNNSGSGNSSRNSTSQHKVSDTSRHRLSLGLTTSEALFASSSSSTSSSSSSCLASASVSSSRHLAKAEPTQRASRDHQSVPTLLNGVGATSAALGSSASSSHSNNNRSLSTGNVGGGGIGTRNSASTSNSN